MSLTMQMIFLKKQYSIMKKKTDMVGAVNLGIFYFLLVEHEE